MALTEKEQKVRLYLIKLASKNTFISYQKLSYVCGLKLNMKLRIDRAKIGELLDAISRYEHKHSRPLLSGIVVNSKATYGPGFYSLYNELKTKNWEEPEETIKFTSRIILNCAKFWQDEQNKKQFENYI